jgi:hypothetical protein
VARLVYGLLLVVAAIPGGTDAAATFRPSFKSGTARPSFKSGTAAAPPTSLARARAALASPACAGRAGGFRL